MTTFNTCRFCDDWRDQNMVRYSTRHLAHFKCYLDAGKKLSDLRPWQVGKFPYFLLKGRGLIDEAKKIGRDETGTALVEFTIILPLILALTAFFLGAFQLLNMRQSVAFVAQASAASGARALDGTEGAIAKATSQATTAYNSNRAAFVLGATPSLGAITALDAAGNSTATDADAKLLRVSVSATGPLLMPIWQSGINATVAATD